MTDEQEQKEQFSEARLQARRLWMKLPLSVELLDWLKSEENQSLILARQSLCVTPPNQERATKQAIRSQTINEILEYVTRTK